MRYLGIPQICIFKYRGADHSKILQVNNKNVRNLNSVVKKNRKKIFIRIIILEKN